MAGKTAGPRVPGVPITEGGQELEQRVQEEEGARQGSWSQSKTWSGKWMLTAMWSRYYVKCVRREEIKPLKPWPFSPSAWRSLGNR